MCTKFIVRLLDGEFVNSKKRPMHILETKPIRNVHQMRSKDLKGECACQATIMQIYHDQGWSYASCTKCRKKVKSSESRYWCKKCSQWLEAPVLRYMLQLRIGDTTAEQHVTAFEETATTLIGLPIDDFIALDLTKNGDDAVKQQLDQIIGAEFIFRIKVTDYNIKDGDSALTLAAVALVDSNRGKRVKL